MCQRLEQIREIAREQDRLIEVDDPIAIWKESQRARSRSTRLPTQLSTSDSDASGIDVK